MSRDVHSWDNMNHFEKYAEAGAERALDIRPVPFTKVK